MNPIKKTKIVATLGPATSSEKVIEKMILAGVNVFRVNFSHADYNDVGKRIKIGPVNLEVIDLCRPCRHLSEKLERNDIIKEFLRKGGIRCQIINDGKISLGDQIKII